MAFLSKLFGKKDKDNESVEAEGKVELDEADPEDVEGLTDEEIEAAERFEEENREEYENTTSLDVDGEFIDFESLIPDDEDYEEEIDEEELDEEENEEALADVEAVYGEGEEEETEDNKDRSQCQPLHLGMEEIMY